MRLLALKLVLLAVLSASLLYVAEAMRLEREAWRFKALAYHDFVPDAERLRAAGRLSEARAMVDFVIAHPELPRQGEARRLRSAVQAERDSWLGSARRLGRGAVTGQGRNAEEVIGAIGADMFAVGDVRDLAIQAWRYLSGSGADPVVAALSAVGLVTTLAPEVDWAPAFLKLARRTGAMTRRFADFLMELARETKRTRSTARAAECLRETGGLVKRLGPSEALGIMRFVEGERDLKLAAQLAERAPKAAYPTLTMGGRETFRILDRAGIEQGAEIATEAAKRGPRGVGVAAQMGPTLFRAHFCVGAGKAIWKGNLKEAMTLALSRLGRGALLGIGTGIALALAVVLTWLAAPVLRAGRMRLVRSSAKSCDLP